MTKSYSRGENNIKHILGAVVRYLTNYFVCYIPSRTLRYLWYRHVLGWRFDSSVTIMMGQYVQMAGVRSCSRKVFIGQGTVINHGCLLYTTGGLTIGENVSISSGAWLITGTHDMNDPQFRDEYKPIVIGDYVWIGVRATVLGGISIGEGSVVMAGAMVTRDVPPYAVVGGVPARFIRHRELQNASYTLNFHPLFE